MMSTNLPPALILGILLTLGSIAGIFAEKIKFPRVVAYILVGALFSPDLLGATFDLDTDNWSPLLTDIMLGIIAYIIGSEINLKDLKKEENTVIWAVLGQSLGVLAFVSLGLWLLPSVLNMHFTPGLYQALVFGAVATATAPAAILGIIEEYKAKGEFTNTLLGIVAVDDGIGIIFFTLILGMGGESGFGSSILEGLREVGGALLLGGSFGVGLGYIGNRFQQENLRLVTIIGFILAVFSLSQLFGFSMLLSCMSLGFISVLFYPKKQAEWLIPLEHIEELVFVFFFTLAGIHFKLNIFLSSFSLVLLYIILRTSGKYTGAFAGLSIAGTDKKTRRLLGLCLFPQAGVAIGLAIRASNQPGFEEVGALLLNIILGSTILFELVAPFVTRYALKKAGEIKPSE
ncbi:cation:proton antiporter [Salinimicrobium sp. TH3]|uniref:cation:proton antiporter n=1 Tax=Salinimicrobium sp. TH3 TaxID=2997342 RepID=UPI002274705E|nr:cation:proton antiporter [Salinimicrobium sp. TH3]MCY2687968.1 cation:proton antiporter [Salinimicrobium sp. TH3]